MKQKQVEEEEAGASSEPHGSPPPPHSAARESAAAAGGGSSSTEHGGSFDCNICLELAQDPVVTLCGHLLLAMPLPLVADAQCVSRMSGVQGERGGGEGDTPVWQRQDRERGSSY
jgi:hypothetical protein